VSAAGPTHNSKRSTNKKKEIMKTTDPQLIHVIVKNDLPTPLQPETQILMLEELGIPTSDAQGLLEAEDYLRAKAVTHAREVWGALQNHPRELQESVVSSTDDREMLRIIGTESKDPDVLARVAINPHTPLVTLKYLVETKTVIPAVKENPCLDQKPVMWSTKNVRENLGMEM